MSVYLDYNATTPMMPQLSKVASRYLKVFGNPSSHHGVGREAKEVLAEARDALVHLLGGADGHWVFTGSGSEANNQVLKSVLFRFLSTGEPCHIVTSAIEHPCVLETLEWMEGLGVSVTYLPVDAKGCVSRETFSEALRPETVLASIMMANNETGGLVGIEDLIPIAQSAGVPFHSDLVQVVGRLPVSVTALGLDFATVSAHKFYGIKGAGALYVREEQALLPLIHGGPQERQLRAGTEPVFPIAMMGVAARWVAAEGQVSMRAVQMLRDQFVEQLRQRVPTAVLNTPIESALPNTVNVSFPGVDAEGLVMRLDLEGIAVSTGSACSTGTTERSHVLTAMGCEHPDSAVRFSFGALSTESDLERVLDVLVQLLP